MIKNYRFSALLVATLLSLCSIFASASPPTNQTKMEKPTILILGSPSVEISALAQRIAEKGAAIVVIQTDDDGRVALAREIPVIVNKDAVIPIATAARNGAMNEQFKIESKHRYRQFTKREFYDLPPDVLSYRGFSFANFPRASPSERIV